ncbi:WXG100 family type VII secretion target [Arthrobacter sp. B3I4]|uniref:WXG100 family type VII secretion target n=1 Tax=Arthrobacter sp. B3I4 TaxID=3042267 RepID=UPI0027847A74|nr:hypothetical protein [Arthrobacter sp. B3I4]MDQ0755906.1 uncharacterized protein YukE [Arthrobacter sp. B3I4]
MAGVLYGADVAQLRAMAAQAGKSAATLQGLQRRLATELAASVHWQGHDAAAFRSDWVRSHSRSLMAAVRLLEAMQRELAANADQQEHASAGDAGPDADTPAAPVVPPALQSMTPRQVLDWWNGLDASQQAGLVRGFPAAAGNTEGLPVAARIEANRLTAESRLAVLEETGEDGTEEAEYLKDTVSGSIKLVAYDPAEGNLVQMIGDYDGDTKTVLTYVPGTFATAGDFYGGTAQKMAAFLQQSDPAGRTAAFVYKNTRVPAGPDVQAVSGQSLRRAGRQETGGF